MLAVGVAFVDQSQSVEGEVRVEVSTVLRSGSSNGAVCPVARPPDVITGEPVDVSPDPGHQAVDQPGEAETAPDCMHSTVFLPITDQGRVSSTRRSAAERAAAASEDTCTPGAIAPPRNSPLAETTSTTIEEPKSTTIAATLEFRICGKTIHDPVGSDFLRVVDQQRYPGSHAGFDQDVGDRGGRVLGEHDPHLVEHRRHGRQAGDSGEAFGVLADEPFDGEGHELVRGDLGFGADPPVLQHLRVTSGSGDQTHDGVGVADVDGDGISSSS